MKATAATLVTFALVLASCGDDGGSLKGAGYQVDLEEDCGTLGYSACECHAKYIGDHFSRDDYFGEGRTMTGDIYFQPGIIAAHEEAAQHCGDSHADDTDLSDGSGP